METPRSFEIEGVTHEIISVQRGWRRLLLAPVYRLIWRRVTFPFARILYEIAFGPALDRALAGADRVHVFGAGTEMLGFAATTIARRKKIPFLVEPAMHAGQWGDTPRDWSLYREADMVIAHTGFEAGILRRHGIADMKVQTVRHGFDARPPGDGEAFRKIHAVTGPMILFIGRRCEAKGYLLLLRAFALLRARVPETTLVIAGPGDTPRCTAPGVVELGRITEETRQDALAACTIFCLPSHGESFGMAYFEAWACGKPVVSLDLPVLQETIGASGGGWLAAPDRPEDLAEKLQALLEQPDLAAAMGQRGHDFARGYSWDAAVEDYIVAYDRARQNQMLASRP